MPMRCGFAVWCGTGSAAPAGTRDPWLPLHAAALVPVLALRAGTVGTARRDERADARGSVERFGRLIGDAAKRLNWHGLPLISTKRCNAIVQRHPRIRCGADGSAKPTAAVVFAGIFIGTCTRWIR